LLPDKGINVYYANSDKRYGKRYLKLNIRFFLTLHCCKFILRHVKDFKDKGTKRKIDFFQNNSFFILTNRISFVF